MLAHLAALLLVATVGVCVNICEKYPQPDPCLPGGVWDPLLQSCSGYGSQSCYSCYSGQFCKTKEDTMSCRLSAGPGNPIYLSEYWLNGSSHDPCTSVLGHYRPGYQFTRFAALDEAIFKIHELTGNAVTEGYHLVPGLGATMVLNLAVAALSRKMLSECIDDCPGIIDVFVQRPYYSGYQDLSEVNSATARWNADADPESPWTMEILTYPNNPSGVKRSPLVKNPDHVIMDMVYYWPMYTDIETKVDHPIMVFSSSKHDGLAGTRFGWVLVKDQSLAQTMSSLSMSIILSFPVDVQLRVITSLQTVISERQGDTLPFHQYGRDVIYSRFAKLRDILQGCPDLELLNSAQSPGAYAWIHCARDPCPQVFDAINLVGSSGTSYGATNNEIRFSMLMPSVEFDIFQEKVKTLCA